MTQTTLRGVVDGLKAEIQMVDSTYVLSIEEVPTLQEVYPRLGQETAEDPFEPIKATFSPKNSDKAIYLHSSGSTGLPKAILLTHEIVMNNASLCEPCQIPVSFLG
jgi:acyl-coenzyme A synthetase/AMP-(fatty) acid ligase